MSRAFTKERDDAPEPQIVVRTLTEPQLMTASGLARLHEQRNDASTAIERSSRELCLSACA